MARQTGGALLSTLKISSDSRVPYYRQLEQSIRRLILNGELAAGQRLPATRQLSKDLEISRLTVKNVYEQLRAEKFLVSRPGAGTYVAKISTSELLPRAPRQPHPQPGRKLLSRRAKQISQTKAIIRLGGFAPFRPGVPALDVFPRKIWASTYSKVLRQSDASSLGYGESGGLTKLKHAIAGHVQDHRGVHIDPQQIIVTAGAQQAFSLIAFTLLNPGDAVWLEDPGHIAGRDAMKIFGAQVESVSLDKEGFNLEYAKTRHPTARLIFVTPSHQHPLGITMSLNRRMEILDYARLHQTWVVEDDYDSEFRYRGRVLPAMQSLDSSGQVLYVGSFSKSLFPALRLGYLISPPSLVDAFAAGQTLLSQNISPILQETLARFVEDGSYNSHIRKMRALYAERMNLLVQNLNTSCRDLVTFKKTDSGLHLIAWLKNQKLDDVEVARAIWSRGIDCLPVSMYCDKRPIDPGIMLGFACAPENAIPGCVLELSRAIGLAQELFDPAD